MSWDSLVLVDDTDLGRFEPEAVNPDMPWGQASWPVQIEQAKRTVQVWVEADYPTIPGASDRLREHYTFEKVLIGFQGVSFTDHTTEAADPDEEDINLTTGLVLGSSSIYLAQKYTYDGIYVRLLDNVNATAITLAVHYWSENNWQAVPSLSDSTAVVAGTPFAESGAITWSRISNWDRRSLDGSDEGLYWSRIALGSASSPDATTSATQILAVRKPEGLRMVVTYLTLSYIMRGLAAQSGDTEEWRLRADNYEERARELYARLQQTGGIPVDTDDSGAVDPSETGSSAILALGKMPRA